MQADSRETDRWRSRCTQRSCSRRRYDALSR